MRRQRLFFLAAALVLCVTVGVCSSTSNAGTPAMSDSPRSVTYEQVKAWVEAYKAAHSGRRGRDADINRKTADEIAAERDTRRLLGICGSDQRPVFPMLAWEYGGSDHPWENPEESALVYCVYTPTRKPSAHWRYDAARDHVIADVYVLFPEHNPCKGETGKAWACIGDPGNLEILVDTASLRDGRDVGLNLSEASTELRLILPNGKRIQLVLNR